MLLTMPKDVGEFVIVHELVHLLVPKHGKLFKLFMHVFLSDWGNGKGDCRSMPRLRGATEASRMVLKVRGWY